MKSIVTRVQFFSESSTIQFSFASEFDGMVMNKSTMMFEEKKINYFTLSIRQLKHFLFEVCEPNILASYFSVARSEYDVQELSDLFRGAEFTFERQKLLAGTTYVDQTGTEQIRVRDSFETVVNNIAVTELGTYVALGFPMDIKTKAATVIKIEAAIRSAIAAEKAKAATVAAATVVEG